MKKILSLTLIAAAFWACGNKEANTNTAANTTTATAVNTTTVTTNTQPTTTAANPLIGQWLTYMTASGETLTINEDGTFSLYSAGKETTGKWEIVDGNKFKLGINPAEPYSVSVKGDTLRIGDFVYEKLDDRGHQ